jgi:hypothetical protein
VHIAAIQRVGMTDDNAASFAVFIEDSFEFACPIYDDPFY